MRGCCWWPRNGGRECKLGHMRGTLGQHARGSSIFEVAVRHEGGDCNGWPHESWAFEGSPPTGRAMSRREGNVHWNWLLPRGMQRPRASLSTMQPSSPIGAPAHVNCENCGDERKELLQVGLALY